MALKVGVVIKRALLALCFFLFVGHVDARQFLHGSGVGVPLTFTAAWQPMLLGDGGNAQGVHVMPSGTIFAHTDTNNNFLYVPSGSCTLGSKTLAAPCWQAMATTGSINSSLWVSIQNSLNVGGGDITECQAKTSNFYMNFNGFVWSSTNRGLSWTKTTQATHTTVNAGPLQTNWLYCDPNDTNGNIVYLNTQSNGAFKTADGGSTWAAVSGPATSATGGSVIYDPTSSVVSNVTQHFWITVDGTGVYETYNGGSSFTIANGTNAPTSTRTVAVDKFGQLWSTPGYNSGSGTISRYVPSGTAGTGTWTTITVGGSNPFLAVLFDPTCSTACATSANNHVLTIDSSGQISASLNNGGAWTFAGTITAGSTAPQALWLGTAQQTSGVLSLNVNAGAIDSSGKMWLAGGISLWTSQEPITGCPSSCAITTSGVPWAANSVGIEQLVVNLVVSPPGNSPLVGVWDKGTLLSANPDAFATVQYPQNSVPIVDTWGLDYALSAVSGTANLLVNQVTFNANDPSTSSDGGNTWTPWAALPTGQGSAAVLAVSTSLNWCTVPGNSSGPNATIFCTLDGAATSGNWKSATITGGSAFIPTNQRSNGIAPITADKTTAGIYYALDVNSNVYRSTNGNTTTPSFTRTANPFSAEVSNGAQKIQAVPGVANTVFVSLGSGSTHLWKTTNGTSWATPAGFSSILQIQAFGFGAPKPGGSGVPMLYAQSNNDTFMYASADLGATAAKINVPTAAQSFPEGNLDYPETMSGDMNVYGRIYYCFIGSGCTYIDTADACPWVNFSNVNMNANLTGTVTLSAVHSGLVPVTGVNFYVDGVQIGSTQTGQSTYSVSWVTGGVATGAHTLQVAASGNGCSPTASTNYANFAIPITTH